MVQRATDELAVSWLYIASDRADALKALLSSLIKSAYYRGLVVMLFYS